MWPKDKKVHVVWSIDENRVVYMSVNKEENILLEKSPESHLMARRKTMTIANNYKRIETHIYRKYHTKCLSIPETKHKHANTHIVYKHLQLRYSTGFK